MKVIKTRKKEITQEYAEEILCNKCGKSIEILVQRAAGGTNYAGGELTARFDYGSKFDDMFFLIDICDNCWKEFSSDFKLEPEEI